MSATATNHSETQRYARTIEASKRVRWDIDRDVLRGRSFDHPRSSCPRGSRSSTSSSS